MSKYILNRNKQDSESGKNYELHNEDDCSYLPDRENRIVIGNFNNCHDAKASAKTQHPSMSSDIDGCMHCCPACHNE